MSDPIRPAGTLANEFLFADEWGEIQAGIDYYKDCECRRKK